MTKKKPAAGFLYRQVAEAILYGDSNYITRDEGFAWPHSLAFVKSRTPGQYTILKVDEGNVCSVVSEAWLAQEIVASLAYRYAATDWFAFDTNQASNCAAMVVAVAVADKGFVLEEMPQPVAGKDETHRLCFFRLPFQPVRNEEAYCPTWFSLLERLTNADAFCAFVYSLLDPEADTSQYLYIYGPGGCGKSSIANFLSKLIGPAFTTTSTNQIFQPHWAENILGKRLVSVTEARSDFPKTDKMKALSGERTILINPKNRPVYVATHSAKFVFTSNYPLEIDSKSENTRRAIYCEMRGFDGKRMDDAGFQYMLWSEAEQFIGYCCHKYHELGCSTGRAIPVDVSLYEDIIEDTELNIATFVNDWFEPDPEGKVFMSVFQTICNMTGATKNQKREVLDYMRRKFNIARGKARQAQDNERVHAYIGIRLTTKAIKQLDVHTLAKLGIDSESLN